MSIDFENLISVPNATENEVAQIQSRLQTQRPAFVSDEKLLAILAFGGTIQSAYDPSEETIMPVAMNPGLERTIELADRFGIAEREITGAILVAKDSRKITNADMIMLIHTIREIENRKILVTCGTYMLPKITQVLESHFGQNKSGKIIGVTGSSLPLSQEAQDADYNIGGAIAAINAFDHSSQKGIVFAQFHGSIFTGDGLKRLELHPPSYKPKFARPLVDVR